MMTRDDILTEVYNSQVLNKMANKYISRLKGNTDDFISHCLLILCEMDEAKLVKLYNDKQLYFYIISCCRNQAVNTKSTFHKEVETEIMKTDFKECYDRDLESN